MAMDVVDYEIFGTDMQYVEVELDPGETARRGRLDDNRMQDGIEMDTIFGDGSNQQGGLFGKLLWRRQAPGHRRVLIPPRCSTTKAAARKRVAFAALYPGRIIPMDLQKLGGTLDLPEGFLPLRHKAGGAGDRLPATDGSRLLRRRGFHHAEARWRRHGLRTCGRHAG